MQPKRGNEMASFKFLTCGFRITVSIVMVMWLFPVITPAADAQSGLRRLFTTPELRAELDRRRLRDLQPGLESVAPIANQPFVAAIAPGEGPASDAIYAIGGTLRRSDGSYTIWINEVATNAADLPANMELVQPFDQGQIQIRNPETGTSFIVKPGQVLNLTQGELLESYEYRSRLATAAQMRAAASGANTSTNAGAGGAAAGSVNNTDIDSGITTINTTTNATPDATTNTSNTAVPGTGLDATPLINPGATELLEEALRVRAILQ